MAASATMGEPPPMDYSTLADFPPLSSSATTRPPPTTSPPNWKQALSTRAASSTPFPLSYIPPTSDSHVVFSDLEHNEGAGEWNLSLVYSCDSAVVLELVAAGHAMRRCWVVLAAPVLSVVFIVVGVILGGPVYVL